jgi:hypothetical protein
MISRELLNEVLGFIPIEITFEDNVCIAWEQKLKASDRLVNGHEINTHELSYILKKWAWGKLGYEIVQYVDVVKVLSGSKELYESVYDIEYDVNEIIKAAQWIYDKNFKA